MARNILIVDDDVAICRTLQLHLRSQDYQVAVSHSVDEGLRLAARHAPDLVILDIRMPGRSGLEGLVEFKRRFPAVHVVMITAFHDMDSTIAAMQRGAQDYIHKPIDIDELDAAVTRILSPERLQILDAAVPAGQADIPTMVGRSHAMKEVYKTIGLVAARPVTVLITGESGTGKELVAQAIHRAGANPDGPFIAVNCAALVETLLESDMFGHEKGAFTGAVNRQAGKFALAGNGTIFLDEVGELSPAMQAKLLRVLQEKEFTPLGAKAPEKTAARVIAATNVKLAERVRQGRFREDLYYRLRVVTVHLPPLRERKDDLLDLVQALLARINKQLNRNVSRVSMDVIHCLQHYAWPGNVRELENVLAKAVALCPGQVITRDLVSDICPGQTDAGAAGTERPLSQWSLDEVTRAHVNRVLEATGWHKGRACDILGVSRPRLRRMIRQFGLIVPDDIADDDDGE
ncbi:MAG TPA: sigma-54-dependent Fis family transcriptional regulator [Gammaproteobacteria bacterium]|nr:sigma-54-dependent Fis family transcriptional regulator [Gammaproteobacteria bacterium]